MYKLTVYIFVLLVSWPALVLAQPTVNLTLDDGTMDEEFLGAGGFTVSRDTTVEGIFVWIQSGGSAIAGIDYSYANLDLSSPPVWTVYLGPGVTAVSVTLTPLKDNFNEGLETLSFSLLEPVAGHGDYQRGADQLAEMSLSDDVATVVLTLDDADMDEATQGTGGFTVTRDNHGNINQEMFIWVQSGGSAIAGVDYSYANLDLSSPPIWVVRLSAGVSAESVTLTPLKDDLYFEDDETVIFTLLDSVQGPGDYIVGTLTTAEMIIVNQANVLFSDGFEN